MSSAVIDALGYVNVFNVATTVIISLVVFWCVQENFSASRAKLPPGPPYIPFPFNDLLRLFRSGSLYMRMLELTKRYGDIMYFRPGEKQFVILSNPKLVKELLVKQADVTSGRFLPPVFQVSAAYTAGIIFNEGEVWQELRRFSLTALRSFGMGKQGVEQRIVQEARILCDTLARSDQPLNPNAYFNPAVSNIINAITFGRRFDYDDPAFVDLINGVRDFASGAKINPILNKFMIRFPILLKTPLFGAHRKVLLGLENFINKEVDQHAKTHDPNDTRDIIDMYLTEVRRLEAEAANGGKKPYLTRDTMWMAVFDLFFAGTETTSTTLLWFVILMAGHPDIQSKVVEEIDGVVGQERAPSMNDRKNMPYTDATLTEVLRFRPIVPMGLPHACSSDVEIGGYTIPRNSNIFINVVGIHHDPRFWRDPEVFNPARFLSDDGKKFIKQEAFEAFGAGRRVCLGEQLAKMELFIFSTSLLQRFRLSLPRGVGADFSYDHCTGGTLVPKTYAALFEER